MKERNYDALNEEYVSKFGECFPARMAPGNEQDWMDIIKKCLKDGNPYNPYENEDYDPDAEY